MSELFVDALARPRPDPGGGAAAAYGASIACALMEKIIRLELQRHSGDPESSPFWNRLLRRVLVLAKEFSTQRESDVRCYLEFSEAKKQGKRGEQLEPFVLRLIECPQQMMRSARGAFLVCLEAGKACSGHLTADLQVANELLGATLRGAFYIACANLPSILGKEQKRTLHRHLMGILEEGLREMEHTAKILASRVHSPIE